MVIIKGAGAPERRVPDGGQPALNNVIGEEFAVVGRVEDGVEHGDVINRLGDVEQRLELDNELPLVVGDVLAVELLEAVDGCPRDGAVQRVRLLELPPVRRLVPAHLDLDRNRGLALLADWDLLVLSLDGCSVVLVSGVQMITCASVGQRGQSRWVGELE